MQWQQKTRQIFVNRFSFLTYSLSFLQNPNIFANFLLKLK